MSNNTGWVAGRGVGLTWSPAFNTTDFTTSNSGGALATTQTVLSSVADITNGTALDMFCDLSVILTTASSTYTASSIATFWLYPLLADGTTYGDGLLASGTAKTLTPVFPPLGAIQGYAAASQTTVAGYLGGLIIPPGSWRFAMQNGIGFTLSGGTVKYRTYNINLNA